MELKDVMAIDTMCRAFYADPEIAKPMFEISEVKEMVKGTFAGVAKRLGLKPGEEWKVLGMMGPGSVEGVVKEMGKGVHWAAIRKRYCGVTRAWV